MITSFAKSCAACYPAPDEFLFGYQPSAKRICHSDNDLLTNSMAREPDPCLALPLVIETLRHKANRLHLRQAGNSSDPGIVS